MDKEQVIAKLWESAGHGTRRQDIEAAYAAGEAAERERYAQSPDECIQPCSGCPTPFRCKDTSGCASAGLSVPTYYARHPDDSYTVAEPQPVLRTDASR